MDTAVAWVGVVPCSVRKSRLQQCSHEAVAEVTWWTYLHEANNLRRVRRRDVGIPGVDEIPCAFRVLSMTMRSRSNKDMEKVYGCQRDFQQVGDPAIRTKYSCPTHIRHIEVK